MRGVPGIPHKLIVTSSGGGAHSPATACPAAMTDGCRAGSSRADCARHAIVGKRDSIIFVPDNGAAGMPRRRAGDEKGTNQNVYEIYNIKHSALGAPAIGQPGDCVEECYFDP